MTLAIVSLTKGGTVLAGRLKSSLYESCGLRADVYVPSRYAGLITEPITEPATGFSQPLRDLMKMLFGKYTSIVCIMSAGIVVRSVSGLLDDKLKDPAVVVVDEKGEFAVSLVGGHWAGANALTHTVAKVLGGQPVITTSTDVQGLTAWDMMAREHNWFIENPRQLVPLNSALANGEKIDFYVDENVLIPTSVLDNLPDNVCVLDLGMYDLGMYPKSGEERVKVILTDRLVKTNPNDLLLRPRNLFVGVGCRRGKSSGAIINAVKEVITKAGRSIKCLAGLASIDIKSDEEGLLEAAKELGVDVFFYPKEEINGACARAKLSISATAREKIGVDGVCEPAALLAAGKGHLIVTKMVFPGVTVALAAVLP